MICFQICIFGPLKTTHSERKLIGRRCDLLSNLYLWTIENNPFQAHLLVLFVVICFQICIFGPLKTTKDEKISRNDLLWFAFKFVSLDHWKQLYYFLYYAYYVVICFQICIFGPLKTTVNFALSNAGQLWFAFKFVSLDHWKQRFILYSSLNGCCDLLSNLYLWTIENNRSRRINNWN